MTNYEYWSPKQIIESKRFPLSMGQLRHLLLNRHKNGLEDAVRKIGRCLAFRMDLFVAWIETQTTKKSS